MNTNDLEENRRDYFRIDDQAEFAYDALSADNPLQHANIMDIDEKLFADQTAIEHFKLMQKFQDKESENENLIRKIYRTNPDLVEYLKHQDEKIQWFMHSFHHANQRPLQTINISLGGIGFIADEFLQTGTQVKMKLIFQPNFYGMFCLASVIESIPLEDSPSKYRISTEFLNIQDKDMQFLNKHIFELQVRRKNKD